MRFFDNVRVVTATLGQGSMTLGAAHDTNFLTPVEAGALTGDTPIYRIDEAGDFEIGWGEFNAGTGLLTRNVIRSKISGVVGTDKMVLAGAADVRFVGPAQSLAHPVEEKGANYTATFNDRGKTVVGTAALTLSLPPAASVGRDWFCHVIAAGGAVTIDPDGAETIGGRETLSLADGMSGVVRSTGVAFVFEGLSSVLQSPDGIAAIRSALALTVQLAATGNINLAAPGALIDGVAPGAGKLQLIPKQTNAAENGIYRFTDPGTPLQRVAGFSDYDAHPGALVTVQEGTLNGASRWQCISAPGGTIDSDPLVFAYAGRAGRNDAANNAFINGGFDVWQESTTFSGAAAGTSKHVCDGFYCVSAGAAVTSISRDANDRTGARSAYSAKITGAASVTTVNFGQAIEAIEMPRLYNSGAITFSCWIYNNSGAAFTPLIYGYTPTASDNYSSTNTVINGPSLQECADGAWTQVTYSFDPSGYTDIDNGLAVEVQIPSGSLVAGDEVEFTEWQLEEGQVLDPAFEVKNYQEVLGSCQRRYEVGTKLSLNGYMAASASNVGQTLFFAVAKRITPALSASGGSTASINNQSVGGATPSSMTHSLTTNGAGSGNAVGNYTGWSADARLKR